MQCILKIAPDASIDIVELLLNDCTEPQRNRLAGVE